MNELKEKQEGRGHKGVFISFFMKKWISAIMAFAFLFNVCMPGAYASRTGNYGDKDVGEYWLSGAATGAISAISSIIAGPEGFWSTAATIGANVAPDIAGLIMFNYFYSTSGENMFSFKLFGTKISMTKGQFWSTLAGVVAGAAGGYARGAADAADKIAKETAEQAGEAAAEESGKSVIASIVQPVVNVANTIASTGVAQAIWSVMKTAWSVLSWLPARLIDLVGLLRTGLEGLWGVIKSAATTAGEAVWKNALVHVVDALGSVGGWVWTNAINPVTDVIGSIGEWVWTNLMVAPVNAVRDAVASMFANGIVGIGNALEWALGKTVGGFLGSVIGEVLYTTWQVVDYLLSFQLIADVIIDPIKSIVGFFSDPIGNIKKLFGEGKLRVKSSPYYKYGLDGQWGKALVNLGADIMIAETKAMVMESVKNALMKNGWDESIASIAAGLASNYVGAFITPITLQAFGYFFDNFLGLVDGLKHLSNLGGYLSEKEAEKVKLLNNLDKQSTEVEVTTADGKKKTVTVTVAQLRKAEDAGVSEVKGQKVYNLEGVGTITTNTLQNAYNDALGSYRNEFRNLIEGHIFTGSDLMTMSGGIMADVHGQELGSILTSGFKTVQNLGLAPIISTAVKIGLLSILGGGYRTYRGVDKEKIFQNAWKMAVADAAGNLAGDAFSNIDVLNTWYAGTGGDGDKLEKNPWRSSGGMPFGTYIATRLLSEASTAASQVLWANYMRNNNILTPGVSDELLHLVGSSVLAGGLDALFRRDTGEAYTGRYIFRNEQGEEKTLTAKEAEELEKNGGLKGYKFVEEKTAPTNARYGRGFSVTALYQDMNNHFLQAAMDAFPLYYSYRNPGTGLNGFQAQQGVYDKIGRYLEIMTQGSTPTESLAVGLTSSLNYWANQNLANSLTYSIANNTYLPLEYKSFATFKTYGDEITEQTEEDREDLKKIKDVKDSDEYKLSGTELIKKKEEYTKKIKQAETDKEGLTAEREKKEQELAGLAEDQQGIESVNPLARDDPNSQYAGKLKVINEKINKISGEIQSFDTQIADKEKEISNLRTGQQRIEDVENIIVRTRAEHGGTANPEQLAKAYAQYSQKIEEADKNIKEGQNEIGKLQKELEQKETELKLQGMDPQIKAKDTEIINAEAQTKLKVEQIKKNEAGFSKEVVDALVKKAQDEGASNVNKLKQEQVALEQQKTGLMQRKAELQGQNKEESQVAQLFNSQILVKDTEIINAEAQTKLQIKQIKENAKVSGARKEVVDALVKKAEADGAAKVSRLKQEKAELEQKSGDIKAQTQVLSTQIAKKTEDLKTNTETRNRLATERQQSMRPEDKAIVKAWAEGKAEINNLQEERNGLIQKKAELSANASLNEIDKKIADLDSRIAEKERVVSNFENGKEFHFTNRQTAAEFIDAIKPEVTKILEAKAQKLEENVSRDERMQSYSLVSLIPFVGSALLYAGDAYGRKGSADLNDVIRSGIVDYTVNRTNYGNYGFSTYTSKGERQTPQDMSLSKEEDVVLKLDEKPKLKQFLGNYIRGEMKDTEDRDRALYALDEGTTQSVVSTYTPTIAGVAQARETYGNALLARAFFENLGKFQDPAELSSNLGALTKYMPAGATQADQAEVVSILGNKGVGLYDTEETLLNKTEVDRFGRMISTTEYNTRFNPQTGKFESYKDDKYTDYNYNQFGLAVTSTKDYSYMSLPRVWETEEIKSTVYQPGVKESTEFHLFDFGKYALTKNKNEREALGEKVLKGDYGIAVPKEQLMKEAGKLTKEEKIELNKLTTKLWNKLGHEGQQRFASKTLFGLTLLGMKLYGKTEDGKVWNQLSDDEQVAILHGSVGFSRYVASPTYQRDNVPQNWNDLKREEGFKTPSTTSHTYPASPKDFVDINKVNKIYLPGEHKTEPIMVPQEVTNVADKPFTVGANTYYDANIYATGSNASPYTGPIKAITTADIRSGPALAANYYYNTKPDLIGNWQTQTLEQGVISGGAVSTTFDPKLDEKIDDLRIDFMKFKLERTMDQIKKESEKRLSLSGNRRDAIDKALDVQLPAEIQAWQKDDALFKEWVASKGGETFVNGVFQNTDYRKKLEQRQETIQTYIGKDLTHVQQTTLYDYQKLPGNISSYGIYRLPNWDITSGYREDVSQVKIRDAQTAEKIKVPFLTLGEQKAYTNSKRVRAEDPKGFKSMLKSVPTQDLKQLWQDNPQIFSELDTLMTEKYKDIGYKDIKLNKGFTSWGGMIMWSITNNKDKWDAMSRQEKKDWAWNFVGVTQVLEGANLDMNAADYAIKHNLVQESKPGATVADYNVATAPSMHRVVPGQGTLLPMETSTIETSPAVYETVTTPGAEGFHRYKTYEYNPQTINNTVQQKAPSLVAKNPVMAEKLQDISINKTGETYLIHEDAEPVYGAFYTRETKIAQPNGGWHETSGMGSDAIGQTRDIEISTEEPVIYPFKREQAEPAVQAVPKEETKIEPQQTPDIINDYAPNPNFKKQDLPPQW